MYGSQVVSDFDLSGVAAAFPSILSWGKQAFQTQLLHHPTADTAEIRRRQLPLLALRHDAATRAQWKTALESLATCQEKVDACCKPTDELYEESVTQVFWKPESFGAFLNSHSGVLNSLIFWKTLVVPFFAVVLPLLTVIIPFFLLQWMGRGVSVTTYMTQIRRILVQQMSIPSLLRAKGDTDKLGYVLESVFVALTLGAFASGIWTQVTSAIHLRSIWSNLDAQGAAVLQTLSVARELCAEMESRGAFRGLAAEGRAALEAASATEGSDPISTYGTLLNTGSAGLRRVCEWLGKVDVYVSLADGAYGQICVPRCCRASAALTVKGVRHPLVKGCITNVFEATEATKKHVLLTGPNRGGKSTYCKAVGLSVLFAQTWGFACASRMTWTPFHEIHSALETNGRLGFNSTFEAEIEFAKGALRSAAHGEPLFVMMDEIFHSTNAVDGVAASKVFLNQLYETADVVSLLSTHYRELAASFEKSVTALMLDAKEGENGELDYSYQVVPGVSDKSSVMEILREKGLLASAAPLRTRGRI